MPASTGNDGIHIARLICDQRRSVTENWATSRIGTELFPLLGAFVFLGLISVSLLAGCGDEKGPIAPPMGTIVIDQTPDELAGAGWQLTGPVSANGSGYTTLIAMQVGEYGITWSQVQGYLTPQGETKKLAANDTVTFAGAYAQEKGTILIDQNPNDLPAAGWRLTGHENASGSGDTTLTDMPVREYTINRNQVSCYCKPSSRTKTLAVDDTIIFVGSYQLVAWLKTYGDGGDDMGYCVQQTSDGGFIVVGQTDSYGAGLGDVCLLRVDANGEEVWDVTFGGSGWDWGESVIETSDGGCIIVGATESVGGVGYDIWLIETDQSGNLLWEKRFGRVYSEVGYCVKETSDGGYIIVGETQSFGKGLTDAWLIRMGSHGEWLWDATIGGTSHDCGRSVYQTPDGSFVIVGFTSSREAGWLDAWLLKVDASGNLLWEKTFGGSKADWAQVCKANPRWWLHNS